MSQTRYESLEIILGKRNRFNLEKAPIKGISCINFSNRTVYIAPGAASSANKGGVYFLRVPPFFLVSVPTADLEFINTLVDTEPDGSSPSAQANQYISLLMSDEVFVPVTALLLQTAAAAGPAVTLVPESAAADTFANPTKAQILNFLFGFNETTWDRLRALGDNVDTVAVAAIGRLAALSRLYGFNGTTWDRLRTSDASLVEAQVGLLAVEHGRRWTVSSAPAVGVQASASRAAGGVGVRHVCTGIIIAGVSSAAPVATKLDVNLRDGASGGGTVLVPIPVMITAVTGNHLNPPVVLTGLNIWGSDNTAMTLEWSALLANLFEAVTLVGYDVS